MTLLPKVFVLATGCIIAGSAVAQRVQVTNPTFPQIDPDGLLNGELPPVPNSLGNGNWPHPASPDGNRFARATDPIAVRRYSDNKARLGKLLFWEEQMSSDNTMACGTCHIPSAGGTDLRDGPLTNGTGGAFGVMPQHEVSTTQVDYGDLSPTPSPTVERLATDLFTPTMIGAHAFNIQFWDGRDGPDFRPVGSPTAFPGFEEWAALEDLSESPQVSDVEMGHEGINWGNGFIQDKLGESFPMALVNPATIPANVQGIVNTGTDYDTIFDRIYLADPDPLLGGFQGVTRERIALAIAHYIRTLVPNEAPIDNGLSAQQVQGFDVMRNAGCFGCHSATGGSIGSTTPLLTASNTLVEPFDNHFADGDRHNIGTGGSRKTPTLRNVGLRRRFFSNGSVVGLDALITFYENRSPPLGFGGPLGANRLAVMDFLFRGLTDPRVAAELPPFDRPELASERPEFNPVGGNEYGTATPGPSGGNPDIVANMPPLVLNTSAVNWFKIGLQGAVANTGAVLMWSLNQQLVGPIHVGPGIAFSSAGNTSSVGIATAHVPFPLDSSTLGMQVFAQWGYLDSGTRGFSNAASFTPFQF